MKNAFNILTGRDNPDLIQVENFYLHKKTAEAFSLLQKSFASEIKLEIISAYRNFDRQLKIWNEKVLGQRAVLDKNEKPIDISHLTQENLMWTILNWSAIPGTSRHHWGCDLDIFDKSIKEKNQVVLTNIEFEEDFKKLTSELSELISLNKSYGFFRPYDKDDFGVEKELWHISHSEVSKEYLDNYTIDILERNINESEILLKDQILKNLDKIYNTFIRI